MVPGRAAARLVWGAIPGDQVDDEAREQIEAGIGGLVLFRPNLTSADRVVALTREIRRLAHDPIRLAVDQEGGHITRIGEPLTAFPGNMALGATRSPELAYAVARATGQELAALGIDTVLAPVLDVAMDPRSSAVGARSFGSDAVLVARLGAAAIAGYRDGGVLASAKHFPGHGRTPLDSHLSRPRIGGGMRALAATDLVPFEAAVAAGVPLVMVGHPEYGDASDERPATLSRSVMQELLRARLRFRGLVLTDAMVMDAITLRGDLARQSVDAVESGADAVMALQPHRRVRLALATAIADGTIPGARIAAALRAGRDLDMLVGSLAGPRASTRDGTLDAGSGQAHAALARRVAEGSLTRAHPGRLLPLDAGTGLLVLEVPSRHASPIEDAAPDVSRLERVLGPRFPRCEVIRLGDPGAGLPPAVADAARSAEVIVLASTDAFAWPGVERLADDLLRLRRPLVHVALQSPADLSLLAADEHLATYASVPASLEALADGLLGRIPFEGVLPVAVPPPPPSSLPGAGAELTVVIAPTALSGGII
jgi:beta-N-acetylhexosaminidase